MPTPQQGKKPVLIVIDDHADTLKNALLHFGEYFSVIIAQDSTYARTVVYNLKDPAILLVDLNLREKKNGLALIKEISEISRVPICFFIFSGDATEKTEMEALSDERVDGYFVKAKTSWRLHLCRLIAAERRFRKSLAGYKDALTGVLTRSQFEDEVKREVARRQRRETRRDAAALLFIDIDKFKVFNDSYGHSVGDEVLRMVASTLQKKVVRTSDIVCRYGGDEFVLLLLDSSQKTINRVIARFHQHFDNLCIDVGDEKLRISVSVGIKLFKLSEVPPDDVSGFLYRILKGADDAMYQDKESKK